MNIVNANMAEKDGYDYSSALVSMGGVWDYVSLNKFLHKPKEYIKGTKMNYAGLKKVEDRVDLIFYLRSLSDSPAKLPTQNQIDNENSQ